MHRQGDIGARAEPKLVLLDFRSVNRILAVVNTAEKDTLSLSDPLTKRILSVADAIGEFIEWWGFKHIHGRIWALLALSKEPLSQADVTRILGISRALASTAMRELQDHGLVTPTDSGRGAPWVAVVDIWPTIANVLREREWMLIERVRTALEGALDEASLADSDGGWDVDRLALLLQLTETAQRFLKMLMRIRFPKALNGLKEWMGVASGLLGSLKRRTR